MPTAGPYVGRRFAGQETFYDLIWYIPLPVYDSVYTYNVTGHSSSFTIGPGLGGYSRTLRVCTEQQERDAVTPKTMPVMYAQTGGSAAVNSSAPLWACFILPGIIRESQQTHESALSSGTTDSLARGTGSTVVPATVQ